jgi:hypothetical protein
MEMPAERIFTVVLSWVCEIELIDFLQHRLQLAGVKKDVKLQMRRPGAVSELCDVDSYSFQLD